jgi:hypothetical protein
VKVEEAVEVVADSVEGLVEMVAAVVDMVEDTDKSKKAPKGRLFISTHFLSA